MKTNETQIPSRASPSRASGAPASAAPASAERIRMHSGVVAAAMFASLLGGALVYPAGAAKADECGPSLIVGDRVIETVEAGRVWRSDSISPSGQLVPSTSAAVAGQPGVRTYRSYSIEPSATPPTMETVAEPRVYAVPSPEPYRRSSTSVRYGYGRESWRSSSSKAMGRFGR